MKRTTGDEIITIAVREIGYHESAGLRTKYSEWSGWNGQPWCMSFVQWVYHQAGADLPYMTASCGALLRWYQQNQPECIVKEPVPGCIVILDFPGTAYSTDHTGLFVKLDGQKIVTIDGNTSGGNDSNGGWVQERTRPLSYANPTYIVPRELRTDGEEEKDVKRYNTLDEIAAGAPWAEKTIKRLIARGIIRGGGATDKYELPADMNLSEDMLRLLVFNDRAGLYN